MWVPWDPEIVPAPACQWIWATHIITGWLVDWLALCWQWEMVRNPEIWTQPNGWIMLNPHFGCLKYIKSSFWPKSWKRNNPLCLMTNSWNSWWNDHPKIVVHHSILHVWWWIYAPLPLTVNQPTHHHFEWWVYHPKSFFFSPGHLRGFAQITVNQQKHRPVFMVTLQSHII